MYISIYVRNHICMCWYIHAPVYFIYISCDVHMCKVFGSTLEYDFPRLI